MLTKSYRVAGHVFSLKMDDSEPLWSELENYSPFAYDGSEESLFTVELVPNIDCSTKKELFISTHDEKMPKLDIYSLDDGYLFEMAPFGNVPTCGWLKVSKDYRRGSLMVTKGKRFLVDKALMILFTFRTACIGTLQIHSSVTVKDGKGYLFLGKSGTGKSTHSSLWLKNVPRTHLLNDDNPIVRIVDGQVRVYGSPWSGKTPCYRNEEFPIGAFVKINQAPQNRIRRLPPLESFAILLSSTSGLRAIRSTTDSLFATISSVTESVPCYMLDCRPDDEAAKVCSKAVLKD